ncbi:DUF4191 domain-containing protein [soil metagenome]|jgi:hypothetical protein
MARKDGKPGRVAQIRSAFTMTRKIDPKVGWVLLAVFLGVLAAFVLIGLLLDAPIFTTILGLPVAVLVTTVVFGRRAEAAAYSQVEGQPGAAAAVLNALRRGWTVTPAVAVTRNQDVIHRAVGRPGVVLVGEGAPSRLTNLLAAERRRHARLVGDTPIYEVQAGDAEDQVRLRKLQRHVMKLPRNLKASEVSQVNRRLRALGSGTPPLPKGPLPRNIRMPKSPRVR